MADILDKITRYKLEEIARAKAATPLRVIAELARSAPRVRPFAGAIEAKHKAGLPALIAEMKKASPSKGLIRADFDPPHLAKAYEAGGAACLSVLTDSPSFQGAPEYLTQRARQRRCPPCARTSCSTPTRLQRRAPGAPTASSSSWPRSTTRSPRDLAAAAQGLAHGRHRRGARRRRARPRAALDCRLIGINNRNLKTFETTLGDDRAAGAARAEGSHRRRRERHLHAADIARLERAGVNTFLVGESLMRQADVTAATRTARPPPAETPHAHRR